jgi:hypothetical protein
MNISLFGQFKALLGLYSTTTLNSDEHLAHLLHSHSLKMLATNAFGLFFSLASIVLALPPGASSGYDTETPKEKKTPKDTPPEPPAPSSQPPYATPPAPPVSTKETICTPGMTASVLRFEC